MYICVYISQSSPKRKLSVQEGDYNPYLHQLLGGDL